MAIVMSIQESKEHNPNPVDLHVGERLRARRLILGISQEKLAEFAGVTFQQIQKYERGKNRISASRLWQFSKMLQVPVSYFFENFRERSRAVAEQAYGLADNDQEGFTGEEEEQNVMERRETLLLIREYYSIPDPKLRKDLLKMIKTMAATMRQNDDE